MSLQTMVFETIASTDSAIPATESWGKSRVFWALVQVKTNVNDE